MCDIGIVVVAVNIEPEIVARFESTLFLSVRSHTRYHLRVMKDNSYVEDGLLNKSRALNDGVRELIEHCRVVVCTDIDMLVPPSLVDYTVANIKPMNNLWVVCRDIDERDIYPRRWEEWMKLPCRPSGYGSWNTMLAEDWIRSGGWDERLTGWGGEDDVFKHRRTQQGIHTVVCEMFPLMHIVHAPRQNKTEIHGGNQEAVTIGKSGPDRNWLDSNRSQLECK